ncbi:hypothetical protein Clacol_001239 [Clathrus columnatus]|uniref:Uncharacterized protein n=1 Tax=Clathrus columnatus TaxID=1419009 RepID=A0AAV5A3A5_9AGAM|nr:hypothetical protein Clacol_001239 [Clathrus columnatus]
MYAPVGKRWTLATIWWWGGWAEGKHHDTLIRYLLDELHYYEEGHGDALRPIKTENHISFMGEHCNGQPVTVADMKTILTSIQGTIMTQVVEDVTSIISKALQDDSHF